MSQRGVLVWSCSSDGLERVIELVKAIVDQLGAVVHADEGVLELVAQHVSPLPMKTGGTGSRAARAGER